MQRNPATRCQVSGVACNYLSQVGVKLMKKSASADASQPAGPVSGQCLCGDVRVEIDFPARWAWHDHSTPSRHAHGAAYATYVGSWRSRFRIAAGAEHVARYESGDGRWTRSFCARCGTPLTYERAHAPQMVNLPRALFDAGTGREPLYH